jgi:hypothetical protein
MEDFNYAEPKAESLIKSYYIDNPKYVNDLNDRGLARVMQAQSKGICAPKGNHVAFFLVEIIIISLFNLVL